MDQSCRVFRPNKMDGAQEYQEMVAEMQFLEFMLDSQNASDQMKDLTRCPPLRTWSEPFLAEKEDECFSATLKSLPVCNNEREDIFDNHNLIIMQGMKDNFVKDSIRIKDMKHKASIASNALKQNNQQKNYVAIATSTKHDISHVDIVVTAGSRTNVEQEIKAMVTSMKDDLVQNVKELTATARTQKLVDGVLIRSPMKPGVEPTAPTKSHLPEEAAKKDGLMWRTSSTQDKNDSNFVTPLPQSKKSAQSQGDSRDKSAQGQGDSRDKNSIMHHNQIVSNQSKMDLIDRKTSSSPKMREEAPGMKIRCRSPPDSRPAKVDSQILVGTVKNSRGLPESPKKNEERPQIRPRRKSTDLPLKANIPVPAPRKKKSADSSKEKIDENSEFKNSTFSTGPPPQMISSINGECMFTANGAASGQSNTSHSRPSPPGSAWGPARPTNAHATGLVASIPDARMSRSSLPTSPPVCGPGVTGFQFGQAAPGTAAGELADFTYSCVSSQPTAPAQQGHPASQPPDMSYENFAPAYSRNRDGQMAGTPCNVSPPESYNNDLSYENVLPVSIAHPSSESSGPSSLQSSNSSLYGPTSLGYDTFNSSPSGATRKVNSVSAPSQPVSAWNLTGPTLSKMPVDQKNRQFHQPSSATSPRIFIPPSASFSDLLNPSCNISESSLVQQELTRLTDQLKRMCSNFAPKEEQEAVLTTILETSRTIDDKYSILRLSDILEKNKGRSLQVPMALGVLNKYATNLLKPISERPSSWKSIKFYSDVIQERVGFLEGSKSILMGLGYTENLVSSANEIVGLKFPGAIGEPNKERVLELAKDLTIATFEVYAIINETHPKLRMLLETGQIPESYKIPADVDDDDDDFFDAQEEMGDSLSVRVLAHGHKDSRASLVDENYDVVSSMRRSEQDIQEFSHSLYQGPGEVYGRASSQLREFEPATQRPEVGNAKYNLSHPTWTYNAPITSTYENSNPFETRVPAASHEGLNAYDPLASSAIDSQGVLKLANVQNKLPSIYNSFPPSPPAGVGKPREFPDFGKLEKPGLLGTELMPEINAPQGKYGFAGDICWNCDAELNPNYPTCQKCGTERDDIDGNQLTIEDEVPTNLSDSLNARPALSTTEPPFPIARPAFPTAEPSFPIDRPVFPTAEPSFPTARPVFSTAEPSFPTARPTFPTAEPSFPKDRPAFSTAEPSFPTARPAFPTTEQSFPTARPAFSTAEPPFPTARPAFSTTEPPFPTARPVFSTTEPPFPTARPAFPTAEPPFPTARPAFLATDPSSLNARPASATGQSLYSLPSIYKEEKLPEIVASKPSENSNAYWSCRHCTFHNPIDTKVCQMCWKTSFVSDEKSSDPNFEVIIAKYRDPMQTSILSPPSGPSLPPSDSSKRQIRLSNVQDPPEFSMNSSLRRTRTDPIPYGQTHDFNDAGPYSYAASGRSNGFPSSLRSNKSTPDIYGLNEAPQSYTYMQQMAFQSQGKHRSMSEYELRKQQELAEQVRREKQHQEDLKKDALELITVMKEAEDDGYLLEEVQLATNFPKMQTRNILHWLSNMWPVITDEVVKGFAEKEIGTLSTDEAKEALIACDGDIQKAIKLCVQERRSKIDVLLKNENDFSKDDVIEALSTCKGISRKALLQLETKALKVLLDRIWKEVPEDPKGFHAKLQNQDMDRNVRIRLVLAHFGMKSWGRADNAIKLMAIKDNKDLVEDCVEAADSNEGLERAKRYMNHECASCFSRFSMGRLFSHISCQCEICHQCMAQNIKVVVMEQNIRNLICPACQKPDFKDEDVDPMHHFQHIGHEIAELIKKGELEANIREMFEDKLRDFSLKNDPNFRWCAHCPEYGFVWEEPQVNKMLCRQCKLHTCFSCKLKWEKQHEGITCEEFKNWKIANDPNNQTHGLEAHLAKNGITCPECQTRFDLAQGGCLHFSCSSCKHQFCGECFQEFLAAGTCKEHPNLGLHAHHPRNCLFYQRDQTVQNLQEMLISHEIEFEKDQPEDQAENKCHLVEQKEEADRKYDEKCGKETVEGNAGLCEKHYKEYLIKIINRNKIDPLEIMDQGEVEVIIRRHFIEVPKQEKSESNINYLERLNQLVKDQIPLPLLGQNGNPAAPPQVPPPQLDQAVGPEIIE